MQYIIIHNNGPIKDFEMNVNKFNILIGEQATGKSTIAKSVYYSRYIKTLISNFLRNLGARHREQIVNFRRWCLSS